MSGVANLILMGGTRRRDCLSDVSNFKTPVSKRQVSVQFLALCFVFGRSLKNEAFMTWPSGRQLLMQYMEDQLTPC